MSSIRVDLVYNRMPFASKVNRKRSVATMAFVLLPYYYYLMVSFFLTVWIQDPLVVVVIYLAFQSIWGIVNDPLPIAELLGWQSLITLIGIVDGMMYVWTMKPPFLLKFKDSHTEVWVKALISSTFFIVALVPYGVWLPPTYAWGVLLSSLIGGGVIVMSWFSLYWVEHLFKGYEDVYYFFIGWILTTVVMSFSFYLTYAIAERWAAIASGGVVLILVLMTDIFCANYTDNDLDHK